MRVCKNASQDYDQHNTTIYLSFIYLPTELRSSHLTKTHVLDLNSEVPSPPWDAIYLHFHINHYLQSLLGNLYFLSYIRDFITKVLNRQTFTRPSIKTAPFATRCGSSQAVSSQPSSLHVTYYIVATYKLRQRNP